MADEQAVILGDLHSPVSDGFGARTGIDVVVRSGLNGVGGLST